MAKFEAQSLAQTQQFKRPRALPKFSPKIAIFEIL
jgi:hypothetical protein